MLAAELLGGPTFGLAFHHPTQLRDLLCRKGFGDLLLGGRRVVALRREQAGQQSALQLAEVHRLERLIGRVGRAATGGVAAVGLDDLGDHRDQTVVEIADIGVVRQQIQQHVPHGLDILGVEALGDLGGVIGQHRATAQRGWPPQVEQRVVGLSVVGTAQHRAGQTLADRLPITQIEHTEHLPGVDGLRGADRDSLPAKRVHEADKVPG